MKIKCGLCRKEETGRYQKLFKKGWLIIFITNSQRVERCKDCKPLLWNRRKNFQEFYAEDIKKEIRKIKDKMIVIHNLKS